MKNIKTYLIVKLLPKMRSKMKMFPASSVFKIRIEILVFAMEKVGVMCVDWERRRNLSIDKVIRDIIQRLNQSNEKLLEQKCDCSHRI